MSRGPGWYQQRILTILAGHSRLPEDPAWWPMSDLAAEVQRQAGQVNRAMLRRSVRSLAARGLVRQTPPDFLYAGKVQNFVTLTEAGAGYQKTRQLWGND